MSLISHAFRIAETRVIEGRKVAFYSARRWHPAYWVWLVATGHNMLVDDGVSVASFEYWFTQFRLFMAGTFGIDIDPPDGEDLVNSPGSVDAWN